MLLCCKLILAQHSSCPQQLLLLLQGMECYGPLRLLLTILFYICQQDNRPQKVVAVLQVIQALGTVKCDVEST